MKKHKQHQDMLWGILCMECLDMRKSLNPKIEGYIYNETAARTYPMFFEQLSNKLIFCIKTLEI